MIDVQELKLMLAAISAAISKAQEPMEELIAVRRFLSDLCANDGARLEAGTGEQAEGSNGLPAEELRWLLEDAGPRLIRQMCRERSRDDQVSSF